MTTTHATSTITRIDPALPTCWEDLDTIRVGFDRAVARVHAPGPAAHRLINALRHGLSGAQLERMIDASGADRTRLLEVVDALGPALVTLVSDDGHAPIATPGSDSGGAPRPTLSLDTAVAWGGRFIPALRAALSPIELLALRGAQRNGPASAPELILHVERFAEPPDRARRWLASGIPHLLVRFSDTHASVGPLIGTSGRPCHGCMTLTRIATEPALPVLAAQLIGTVPASEHGPVARVVATVIEHVIASWISGDEAVHLTEWTLPVTSGRVSGSIEARNVTPHAECACGLDSASPVPAPFRPSTSQLAFER